MKVNHNVDEDQQYGSEEDQPVRDQDGSEEDQPVRENEALDVNDPKTYVDVTPDGRFYCVKCPHDAPFGRDRGNARRKYVVRHVKEVELEGGAPEVFCDQCEKSVLSRSYKRHLASHAKNLEKRCSEYKEYWRKRDELNLVRNAQHRSDQAKKTGAVKLKRTSLVKGHNTPTKLEKTALAPTFQEEILEEENQL